MKAKRVFGWCWWVGCLGLLAGCAAATEDVEGLQEGLVKPFGLNGDGNYCNDPANPCVAGEGDCDAHSQCLTGFCGRDNGEKFGFATGLDVCVPAHCQNKRWDGDELATDCGGSCGTNCNTLPCSDPNGSNDKCTDRCPCASGEGDCDSTVGCQPGLVCGRDNGARFGFKDGSDVCVPPHCQNRRMDGDETQVDCGGACGSIGCPVTRCLTEGAHWYVDIAGSFVEQWPRSGWGNCIVVWSGSYQRRLELTVVNGALEVAGEGFAGTYRVVNETATTFQAQETEFDDFTCGYAFPDSLDPGFVTLSFDCNTNTVSFAASCRSEINGDGCSPNYEESASGTGALVSCGPGYVVSRGFCVQRP